MGKGSDSDFFEVELLSISLEYFKKHGDVIVLISEGVPHCSWYGIKGYAGGGLSIVFIEIVKICKEYDSYDSSSGRPILEYSTKIFDTLSPVTTKGYNLAFYTPKAGSQNMPIG